MKDYTIYILTMFTKIYILTMSKYKYILTMFTTIAVE